MTSPATPSRPLRRAHNRRVPRLHPLALGYQTLGRAARTLPRPAAYAAAHALMRAVYRSWPLGRRAARRNAQRLLGSVDWSGDADSLARAQFQRYGEYLVDAVRLDELSPADCFAAVGGDDAAFVDQWRQLAQWYQRRPILFAVLHFGNWDVLGGAFTHRVGPSVVLVDDLGHHALNQAIQGQRARLGMTPVSGRSGLRRVVAHLRANGTAAILFDRPARANEQTARDSLFGHEVMLSNAIQRIAAATDAKLIPLAAERCRDRLHFRPYIDLKHVVDQPLLAAFEPPLAAAPDQWYQFRELF